MKATFLIPATLGGFLLGRLFSATKPKGNDKPSPLPGVLLGPWEGFVSVMATSPKEYVSPRYRLGAFQMDARRLKDIGFMASAGKGVYGDKAGVWVGEFLLPLTKDKFLGSMPLQYAAFVRSMRAAAPRVGKFVGARVEGGRGVVGCSLSGLLGVSHAAGEGGVESWVADASVRKRFPGTTERFDRTNGIF